MDVSRKKAHWSYLFVFVVFAVQFFPRTNIIKYALIAAMYMVSVLSMGKTALRIKKGNAFLYLYASITVLNFAIHYYSLSIQQILAFVASFVFCRHLILHGINTKEDFDKVLDFIITLFGIYAILVLIEAFIRINVFDIIFSRTVTTYSGANGLRFGFLRPHGFCTISQNNAMVMTMAITLTSYKLFNTQKAPIRWKISYSLLFVAIIFEFSRAVTMVLLISQVVILAKCGYTKLLKRLLLVVLGVAIFAVVANSLFKQFVDTLQTFLLSAFSSLFLDAEAGFGSTNGDRSQLFSWVYNAVKDNIFFGMGYEDSFSVSLSYTVGTFSGIRNKTSIENHWLFLLYQTGLFGLIPFIIYQIGCLKRTIKLKVRNSVEKIPFNYAFAVISILYFVVIISFAAFEDLLYYYLLFSLFEVYVLLYKQGAFKKQTESVTDN